LVKIIGKKRIGKKNNMSNNYGKTRNTQAWRRRKEYIRTQHTVPSCKTPKNNEIKEDAMQSASREERLQLFHGRTAIQVAR
jgi:hypothetical protein